MKKISKHVEECLAIIIAMKKPIFNADDIFPKVKRGQFIIGKLIEAGYVQRAGSFKYNLVKRACDNCGKPFAGVGYPMKALDGPEPWQSEPGLEQCDACMREENK